MLKILIVEDETITGLLLKKSFEKKGFLVTDVIRFGEEISDSMKTSSPDVILVDIQLAGEITGVDAVRNLQPDIPVIFMSGYNDKEIILEAERLNPLGFFVKPLDVDEVISIIEA